MQYAANEDPMTMMVNKTKEQRRPHDVAATHQWRWKTQALF
jgi:hypothetical protein